MLYYERYLTYSDHSLQESKNKGQQIKFTMNNLQIVRQYQLFDTLFLNLSRVCECLMSTAKAQPRLSRCTRRSDPSTAAYVLRVFLAKTLKQAFICGSYKVFNVLIGKLNYKTYQLFMCKMFYDTYQQFTVIFVMISTGKHDEKLSILIPPFCLNEL